MALPLAQQMDDPSRVPTPTSIGGREYRRTANQRMEPASRLFPLHPDLLAWRTPWIKITDWSNSGAAGVDPGSPRRGRLLAPDHVAPFFETLDRKDIAA